MKKIIIIMAAFLITSSTLINQRVNAQAPDKMSYQAVIRDNDNVLVSNQAVGMRISIIQSSIDGTAVYVETQTPMSNDNGLVSLEIGTGTVVNGEFTTIDWASDTYFIKTETDPTGGSSYSISGTSQLMSVPYALHANTATSIIGGINETDPVYAGSQASLITASDITKLSNISGTNTGDQQLSVSTIGDTLYLSNGNWVIIPGISAANLETPLTVMDIDGNVYSTVEIGNQVWMVENLKTTKYRNGETILNVTDNTEWSGLTTGGYSWVNNDINNKNVYGAMYNFYAVTDNRNICPSGWHASTDEDFKILEVSLGMSQEQADAESERGTDQGTQLKSTTGWNEGENGTNTSGFSALPSGSRYNADGLFYAQLVNAHFWMATESSSATGWYRVIFNNQGSISRIPSANKANGMVVRCVKD